MAGFCHRNRALRGGCAVHSRRVTVDDQLVDYSVPDHPPAPPRLGVLQAVQRHLLLVLLPVVLLAGAAVAYGLLREPTYTSEARLNVGGLNLTQQSIEGYTHAVEQLAVAYSRAIDATAVVDPVSRQTGLSPVEVADRISATPIQGSPVIRIRATSSDSTEARVLADLAAGGLVSYAVELNSGNDQSSGLFRRYVRASEDYRAARIAASRLKPSNPRFRRAQVRSDVALLKQRTAGALYQQSLAGQATTNLVQKLAPAAPATDDRMSVLQRLLAAALIAGLLIGVGLAVWRANRVTLRRFGGR